MALEECNWHLPFRPAISHWFGYILSAEKVLTLRQCQTPQWTFIRKLRVSIGVQITSINHRQKYIYLSMSWLMMELPGETKDLGWGCSLVIRGCARHVWGPGVPQPTLQNNTATMKEFTDCLAQVWTVWSLKESYRLCIPMKMWTVALSPSSH